MTEDRTPEQYVREQLDSNLSKIRDGLLKLRPYSDKLAAISAEDYADESLTSMADMAAKASESITWLGLMLIVLEKTVKEPIGE